ncbi:type 1 glutamine amidotransferase [soil metagenome]
MSTALVLQHSPNFGPGRIIPVLRDFGIPTEIRRLWQGDDVPADLDEVRVLIVLEANHSFADANEMAKFPYLAKEVSLLQRAIAADRATLGIGFGARLLAHAAGAKISANAKPGAKPDDSPTPMPEYGWGPVTFPFPGGTEPIVYGLIDGTPMFHWHSETLDLPKLPAPANPAPPPAPPPPTGNALLSSSRATRNQAFRYKTRLFGFQYHFELTQEDFEKIYANEGDLVARAQGGSDRTLRDQTTANYPRYSRAGERILQNFVQYLRAY